MQIGLEGLTTGALTRAGRLSAVTLLALGLFVGGAGCGSSNKKTSSTATEAKRPPSTPAKQQAGPADPAARAKLQRAGGSFNRGQKRFIRNVISDARARNLQALKADTSQFRDVIFNFDGKVRRIHFPPARQTDVNAALEGNRTIIAELDAMGSANDLPEFARLFKRFTADKRRTIRAVNKLINKLQAPAG